MISKTVFLIVGVLLLAHPTLAQRFPSLVKVEISARVSYDSARNMYYYSYSLSNDPLNAGSIEGFLLDIDRGQSSIAYDTAGLRFADSDFMELNFKKRYPNLSSRIVPVGFHSLPHDWYAMWGNLTWALVTIDTNFIAPGQQVNGIVLMSKGLPGIRTAIVRPHFNVDRYFPSVDSPASILEPDQIDSIRESLNYSTLTVGPWVPDSNFRPNVFVDTLLSFVRECRRSGWISNQPTTEKYIDELSRIRMDLSSGSVNSAIGGIDRVLQQANADKSSALAPEAYTIIWFNTQYLKDRIQPTTH